MILEDLTISRLSSWKRDSEDQELQYEGAVKFKDRTGEIKLVLDNELSQAILDVVADRLVETSKKVAEELTVAIIEARVPQLEGPEVEGEL